MYVSKKSGKKFWELNRPIGKDTKVVARFGPTISSPKSAYFVLWTSGIKRCYKCIHSTSSEKCYSFLNT